MFAQVLGNSEVSYPGVHSITVGCSCWTGVCPPREMATCLQACMPARLAPRKGAGALELGAARPKQAAGCLVPRALIAHVPLVLRS